MFTAFQNASTVCAEIMSLAAAAYRRGNHYRKIPSCPRSNTSRIATRAALAFSESKIVSTSSNPNLRQSAPGPDACTRLSPGRRSRPENLDHPHPANWTAKRSAAPWRPPQTAAARSAVPTRSAHSRHWRADCSLISHARSLRNRSSIIFDRTQDLCARLVPRIIHEKLALPDGGRANVLVSIMSAPASRKRR